MERNIKSKIMKIRITFTAILAVLLATVSCGPKYTEPVEASQVGFAISLFRNVNDVTPKTENVVVSPYSAAVALSMLAEGAVDAARFLADKPKGLYNMNHLLEERE